MTKAGRDLSALPLSRSTFIHVSLSRSSFLILDPKHHGSTLDYFETAASATPWRSPEIEISTRL